MSTPPKSDKNQQKKTKCKNVAQMQRKLDEFIQTSLDKYHFVDVSQKMLDVASIFSRHIVSNKSAIPDLVIYNKKFNKNDCFLETNPELYLPFPRIRYILKAKPRSELRNNKEICREQIGPSRPEQINTGIKREKESQEKQNKKIDFQFNNKVQGKNLIPMSINSLFEIEHDTKENTSEQSKDKNNLEEKDLETEIVNLQNDQSASESFSYINKCLNDDEDSFKNTFEVQQSFDSKASDDFPEEKEPENDCEFPSLFADYSLFTKRKSTPNKKISLNIYDEELSYNNCNTLDKKEVYSRSINKQKLNVNFENKLINNREICNNNVSKLYYSNSNQINIDKNKSSFVFNGDNINHFKHDTFLPENNIISLIRKNCNKRDWLLLENSIIIRSFNSFELYQFFNDQISCGKNISSLCIINHDNNSSINPLFLYESIKEHLPDLFESYSKECELNNPSSRVMLDNNKTNKFNNLNCNNNIYNYPFNIKNTPVINTQISFENNNTSRQFNTKFGNFSGNNSIIQRNPTFNNMNSPPFTANIHNHNVNLKSNTKSVSPINIPLYNLPLTHNQFTNFNNPGMNNKFNQVSSSNGSISDFSNEERTIMGYPHSTKNMFVNPLNSNINTYHTNNFHGNCNNNVYKGNNGGMFTFIPGLNSEMNQIKMSNNEMPHELSQRELGKPLPFNNKFSAIDKFSNNLQIINSN